MQHLRFERVERRQSRQVQTEKGNLKHLEAPRDFSKARHNKHAPYSIQACEQSAQAGRQEGVGSAGGQDPAMVLQNDLNGVLHCKLSPIWLRYSEWGEILLQPVKNVTIPLWNMSEWLSSPTDAGLLRSRPIMILDYLKKIYDIDAA